MFDSSIVAQLQAACIDHTTFRQWLEWLDEGTADEQDALTFVYSA
jgi:hypothetical protein